MTKFKYIDLFAGVGGFHQAMKLLGGECVFASEIDNYAIETYKQNYGINARNDITKVEVENIPKHDVLCAGFPCQPFSKAGVQLGFTDKTKGTLFFQICKILKYHKTPYIILENVKNLVTHDNGRTLLTIKKSLHELGYIINDKPIIISPHHLGIPQLRERIVIVGIHKSIGVKKIKIELPNNKNNEINLLNSSILEDKKVANKYYISEHEKEVLTCWDEFVKGIKYVPAVCKGNAEEKKYEKSVFNGTIGFPIWSSEFKENYDYSFIKYNWKKEFIVKNRCLYEFNKTFIDEWLEKWDYLNNFTATEKKFEWQCGKSCKSIWDGLIQFRPSGIRVKTATVFPALVAIVQIPIIGKVKRRLTPREAARLQSFPDNFICNPNDQQAYKQFGNAVNVKVIKYVAEQLFNQN